MSCLSRVMSCLSRVMSCLSRVTSCLSRVTSCLSREVSSKNSPETSIGRPIRECFVKRAIGRYTTVRLWQKTQSILLTCRKQLLVSGKLSKEILRVFILGIDIPLIFMNNCAQCFVHIYCQNEIFPLRNWVPSSAKASRDTATLPCSTYHRNVGGISTQVYSSRDLMLFLVVMGF